MNSYSYKIVTSEINKFPTGNILQYAGGYEIPVGTINYEEMLELMSDGLNVEDAETMISHWAEKEGVQVDAIIPCNNPLALVFN